MSEPSTPQIREVTTTPLAVDLPGSTDTTAAAVPHTARPGDLVTSWRVMLTAAWFAAFFAYAAIWQASVQIGISTWWLGPRAQPTNPLIRLLPFYLTLTVGLCVIYNVRHLIRVSSSGVALAALIALPDLSRSTSLAIAEFVIPASLALITAAASTGRYRSVEPTPQVATDDLAPTGRSGPGLDSWGPPEP